MNSLGTAPEDTGVARLQAQRGGIGGHVGPGFVDDADDSQGNPHPAHLYAGRPVGEPRDFSHRIGQSRDLPKALSHGSDSFSVDIQPFQHGAVQAPLAARLQVFAVLGDQGFGIGFQGIGDGDQRPVLGRRLGAAHRAGSGAGLFAHGAEGGLDGFGHGG